VFERRGGRAPELDDPATLEWTGRFIGRIHAVGALATYRERPDMVRQMADILAGYEDFCDFDPRQLYLVEALRTLRLIHYSAWLARRWDDPAFPAAFPWFNTQRYWQDRILELREQIALMDEPPLWPA
jgi:Ser/Thr protein kinase RdoA (MazF antagonist)